MANIGLPIAIVTDRRYDRRVFLRNGVCHEKSAELPPMVVVGGSVAGPGGQVGRVDW